MPTKLPGDNLATFRYSIHPMNDINQIDLHKLSPAQLRELNARIVERLKYMSSVNTIKSMNKLNLGQRVCFDADGETVVGVLIKLNQKTVVIAADDGLQWKVSPQLVKPVIETVGSNVTTIHRNKMSSL